MPPTSTSAILVTGATGFIGSHVAERLIKEGRTVKLLIRNEARLLPALRQAELVIGDLADPAALDRAVEGAAVIIHCAANVQSWDSRENYLAANVAGTENLLQAAIRMKSPLRKFVHLSTVDVYGFPAEPCDETAPIVRSGFGYGDSKAEGETLVRRLCAGHAIPYTILRPCNVIGPRGQFVQRIGDALRSGPMLTIDGGSANAGLLYIDNLVDVILWAADADDAAGECFNARDPYDASWAEFLAVFRKSLEKRGWMIDMPFRVADVLARGCALLYRLFLPSHEPLLHPLLVRIFGRTCGHDAGRIRRAGGLLGQVDFDEAMSRSIAWYLGGKN